MVEELGQIFESSGVVVVAQYTGLTVAEMQDLRARAVSGSVCARGKNRLAKIALNGKSCESMGEYLSGMTVLTILKILLPQQKLRSSTLKIIVSFKFWWINGRKRS